MELRGMGGRRLAETFELHHDDLKAMNSKEAPDEVSPSAHPAVDVGRRAAEGESEAAFVECLRNRGRGRPGLRGCETWIGR